MTPEQAAALSAAGGQVLGMVTQKWQNQQQYKQAKKLQGLSIEGSKEMGRYNQELAIDTWQQTGPEAQRKQLEKAGLNVGLMYQGSGPGGTTSQPGNVGQQAAQAGPPELAGMGIQFANQMALLRAQKENIEADTKLKNADAAKTAGVDTEAVTEGIAKLKAETENVNLKNMISRYEGAIKRVEANVAEASEGELINQIKYVNDKLVAEIRKVGAEGKVAEDTINEQVRQAQIETVQRMTDVALTKANIKKVGIETAETRKKIQKIGQEIYTMLENLKLQDRAVTVQELKQISDLAQQEFNTSTAAQIKQWTEIVKDITESVGDLGGMVMKKPKVN